MWGIIPAAGTGSRIRPLAFSKELLPVGSRMDGEAERPRAVSEYVLERMVTAGASRICFVVAAGKGDILAYFGATYETAHIAYVVQPKPAGLCDAIFQALPLVADSDPVLVGLPDTVWFPIDGLRGLGDGNLELLVFSVEHPELFDAVVTDSGRVLEVEVKKQGARSNWVWGAFKTNGRTLRELHALWRERDACDAYFGNLVNAWIAHGGRATAVRAPGAYVDVGTVHGYRQAIGLLASMRGGPHPAEARPVVGRLAEDSAGNDGQ